MTEKDYQIRAINRNIENQGATITLYKEDYTDLSWEMILRDLNIEFYHNTNANIESITIEVAKVVDIKNNNN